MVDATFTRCVGDRKASRNSRLSLYNSRRTESDEGRLMDENNPVVKLCAQGMQAEGEGRSRDARELYEQAWAKSKDGFKSSTAAHYLARQQQSVEGTFRWNKEALERAEETEDERVRGFYSSLYLNMGKSHEDLGDIGGARRCYEEAAKKAEDLPDDGYANMVRRGVDNGLRRVAFAKPEGAPSLPSK